MKNKFSIFVHTKIIADSREEAMTKLADLILDNKPLENGFLDIDQVPLNLIKQLDQKEGIPSDAS